MTLPAAGLAYGRDELVDVGVLGDERHRAALVGLADQIVLIELGQHDHLGGRVHAQYRFDRVDAGLFSAEHDVQHDDIGLVALIKAASFGRGAGGAGGGGGGGGRRGGGGPRA